MSARTHRCVRCGIDVYVRGRACTDCHLVDPDTCRALTARRTP